VLDRPHAPRSGDALPRLAAHRHLESLKRSTLREQTGGFEQRNLIGSPARSGERIRVYRQAGVTTLSGLLFVANTVPEMQEAIDLFGREVIPNFR